MPTRGRILLVRESGYQRVREGLVQAGFAVESAAGVDAASERVRTDRVDGIVAAYELSDGTGVELCTAVREHDRELPVVLVGDHEQGEVAEELFEADVTAYVRRERNYQESAVEACRSAVERYLRYRDTQRIHADGPAGGCVLRDGVITYASPSLASFFDVTPDAIEGVPFVDLVSESDRERVADDLATLEAPVEMTFTATHSNGETVQALRVFWRAASDAPNASGATDADAIVGTVIDVTEHTEQVRDLRRDKAMLDSLLENVPLSIYFKDRQSRHERVSEYMTKNNPEEYIKNAEGKVHPHAADVLGKTDFDLYSQSFAAEVVEDDRRIIESGATITNRIEASTTGNGEQMYTSTTKAPRYDADGTIVGLVGVTIDVTDRVRYRKELERHNERLEEFAEVLTHDLRNPVNIAQGHITLLQEEYDPDAVDSCASALDRISQLIDEIREFVLQGRSVDSTEPVAIASVARRAWETVDTADAELRIETDRRIRADPDRLQRLFENLFRNAVEHGSTSRRPTTDDGVAHSSIRSQRGNRADDAAEYGASATDGLTVRLEWTESGFAVADDGAGLPEIDGGDDTADDTDTDAELLFERGYTTATHGTGFGLAIVRDIAEAHGWDVSATTGADGGARFEFDGVGVVDGEIGRTYGA